MIWRIIFHYLTFSSLSTIDGATNSVISIDTIVQENPNRELLESEISSCSSQCLDTTHFIFQPNQLYPYEKLDEILHWMWSHSFEIQTNNSQGKRYKRPRKHAIREVSAWITENGILISPWQGPLLNRKGEFIDEFGNTLEVPQNYKNAITKDGAISYNNYLPIWVRSKGNIAVKFQGIWINVIGQIHTHPLRGFTNSSKDKVVSDTYGINFYNYTIDKKLGFIFDANGVNYGTTTKPCGCLFTK